MIKIYFQIFRLQLQLRFSFVFLMSTAEATTNQLTSLKYYNNNQQQQQQLYWQH